MTHYKDLCLALVKAESEDEVVDLLKEYNLWDNPANWRNFGDDENNFSVIGNQQSKPESAIVEKLVNSVDATLMAECLGRNINPESDESPRNINQALSQYFGIHEGKLTNISPRERSALAEKIGFVATGSKSNPNYAIFDMGEGQSPARLPDTILSIRKSNKLRIPFVQGKFNMGGTGVFRFCGERNIQLVISRRNPNISQFEQDPMADFWGFTIIRRNDPSQGVRSSSYKYLAPFNQILFFQAEELPILPTGYPEAYGRNMQWGTYLKLYNYKIGPGLRTNILFDLYNKLSLLMPQIALPVKFYERRRGYKGNSFETVLSGLSVRVDEDRSENIEDGFPTTGTMTVNGQSMKYSIYAFKKLKHEKFTKDEGIVFTINGQTHGYLTKAFFSRQRVGMNYLANSILVILDCSEIDGRAREDLFMNSRDRLSTCPLRNDIEAELEELLKNHPGLRQLKDKRRREEVENRLANQQPLADVLKGILQRSPTLSRLFIQGLQLSNPYGTTTAKNIEQFEGKYFPTFFKLEKKYSVDKPKQAHINSRFRVVYQTDVVNDYFDRAKEQGTFKLFVNAIESKDAFVNLWNGHAYLNVMLTDVQVGEIIHFRSEVLDVNRPVPIVEEFYVQVVEALVPGGNGSGGNRRPPSGNQDGDGGTRPNSFQLPNIIEVSRDGRTGHNWDEHAFDKDSALKVMGSPDDGYDFFVNVDNIHLRAEMRNAAAEDIQAAEAKYKFGQVLLGLSLLNNAEKFEAEDEENRGAEIFQLIEKMSAAVSPVIIPMIDNLSAMDLPSLSGSPLEESN